MKYDNNNDVTHDKINTGDKIWFLDEKKYIANVLEKNKNIYTIAYYCEDNRIWLVTTTEYENIFPRVRDVYDQNIYEIYDVVLVTENNVKSLGVVTGFEDGRYIVAKYSKEIWRRVVVSEKVLEHHKNVYDEVLFNNRQALINASWLKWQLPKSDEDNCG